MFPLIFADVNICKIRDFTEKRDSTESASQTPVIKMGKLHCIFCISDISILDLVMIAPIQLQCIFFSNT